MALDFPNSPSVNDSFNAGGKTWVYNGTKWVLLGVSLNQTVADGSITQAKLAADSVTSAKIAAGAVGTTDLAANAVTQAKLAANVSAVTVTTAANRGTDVPSPFTGQLVFLTDTKKIQVWDGTSWLNITLAPPETPTSLSATALSTTSVSIAFTPGGANGSPITNYKYALSTNSGSTYGAFTALDPADTTSPITISGLTQNTAYYIKLKAVNDMGDSVESAAVTVTTLNVVAVDYLVVAGGGGGGQGFYGGGGGAGGLRSTVTATGGGGVLETSLNASFNTNYAVAIGAGGAGSTSQSVLGSNGVASSFGTVSTVGGGGGHSRTSTTNGSTGGSSGGGSEPGVNGAIGAPTANQGFTGGGGVGYYGCGGGGAGAVGVNGTSGAVGGNGGAGVSTSITGSLVAYGGGGGGGGGNAPQSVGGSGGGGAGALNGGGNGAAGTANTGGGGGGGGGSVNDANGNGKTGGSGVVILRYLSVYTITIGAGLTGSTSTVGSDKVTTITAGSGNVSWA